jgi:hypothetical protein
MGLADRIMDRDVEGGLGVVVSVEELVHRPTDSERARDRVADQTRRHLRERSTGAKSMLG